MYKFNFIDILIHRSAQETFRRCDVVIEPLSGKDRVCKLLCGTFLWAEDYVIFLPPLSQGGSFVTQ